MDLYDVEAFYYVAIAGDIAKGARSMPRPIQRQSASEHVQRLELTQGAKLWDRERKRCTAAGVEMLERIRPFFEWRHAEIQRRRNRHAPPSPVRIATSDLILNEYLPALLGDVLEETPELRFAPIAPTEADMRAQLERGEVHLVIASRDAVPPQAESISLVRLPLALVVRADSGLRTPAQCFAARDRLGLVCPGAETSIGRRFRAGLQVRGQEWLPAITTHAVDKYLRHGRVGVSVDVERVKRRGLGVLPLKDFERLEIVAAWNRGMTAALAPLLKVLRQRAAEIQANGGRV